MKMVMGAVALLIVSNAMGAYQYNWKGNQGWLTFDGTTTIASDLTVDGRKEEPGDNDNYIDEGGNFNDYGWYNLDTGTYGSFNNGTAVTFTGEDRIGLWVKDNAGDVYLSTKPDNSAPDNVFWGKTQAISGGYSVAGGNFGSNGTQEYYIFKVNYDNASSSGDAPNGQPLPGIAATLLVGGGALIYLKKRRRNLQAK